MKINGAWGQCFLSLQRDGDLGPVPAPQRGDPEDRPQLPDGEFEEKSKRYQRANGSDGPREVSQTVPPPPRRCRSQQLVAFDAQTAGTVSGVK